MIPDPAPLANQVPAACHQDRLRRVEIGTDPVLHRLIHQGPQSLGGLRLRRVRRQKNQMHLDRQQPQTVLVLGPDRHRGGWVGRGDPVERGLEAPL